MEELKLSDKETAVLTVLMLRGPQTSGEIRSRSGRLYNFSSLQEIESTIEGLNSREDGPFVVKMERQSGMKERRYAHLLSGEPVNIEVLSMDKEEEEDKLECLQKEIEMLKSEIENLKNQFAEFRRQFE